MTTQHCYVINRRSVLNLKKVICRCTGADNQHRPHDISVRAWPLLTWVRLDDVAQSESVTVTDLGSPWWRCAAPPAPSRRAAAGLCWATADRWRSSWCCWRGSAAVAVATWASGGTAPESPGSRADRDRNLWHSATARFQLLHAIILQVNPILHKPTIGQP